MTTRNAAAAAAADALSKAGPASVLFHKSSNSYFIRCAHYNTKGVNGVRKEAHGYPTKADAEAEVDLFRFAVHHDGGRTWQNWSKKLSEDAVPCFPARRLPPLVRPQRAC
jgi:hypothetical protein